MSFASFFPSSDNIVRTPRQAANAFTNVGGFAKQRGVFLVRFVTTTTGPIMQNFSDLTYAVKSIDRPKVNMKTEELNQYNKKRIVHTGYKLEPIKIQLYDSADGSAQNMFAAYCQYYFGDLMNQGSGMNSTNFSYSYDATMSLFRDFSGGGFGFTGQNGPVGGINTGIDIIDSLTADAQFFFDRIEIYHFYDGLFDLYQLAHPRFTAFDLTDLDYGNQDVSMINMSMVYENLEYFPQNEVDGFDFSEFSDVFDGNPLEVPDVSFPINSIQPNDNTLPSNPTIASLLTSSADTAGVTDALSSFRYSSAPSTGPISIFGSFSFGPATVGNTAPADLSNLTLGNNSLTTALNVGSSATLGSGTAAVYTTAQAGRGGLNPALYDSINSTVNNASTGFGGAASIVTKGLLASGSIDGSGATVNNSGQISLPATAFGAINSQQTGTAQYGFNSTP